MKRALVLGGAMCLWEDIEALVDLVGGPWPGTVVATNDAGWAYPRPIHYWVSLHMEKMPFWIEKRRRLGHPMDPFEVWGGSWRTGSDDSRYDWVDHTLPVTRVGSSGLHAVDVALHPDGAAGDVVVVAGVPMDFRPHFFGPVAPWNSPMAHRDAWEGSVDEFGGRVRSMSGWTRNLLGTPDRAWLGL